MENKVSRVEFNFCINTELEDVISRAARLIDEGYIIADFHICQPTFYACMPTGLKLTEEPDAIMALIRRD